ncbi:MAG: hypothetical protein P8Y69_04020 [Gammaproteobacteria bacterium]
MNALIVGPFVLAVLCVGWLGVQALWRHTFDLERGTDVLEGRCGCGRSQICKNLPAREDGRYRSTSKEKGHA